jgi:hypothetical protein
MDASFIGVDLFHGRVEAITDLIPAPSMGFSLVEHAASLSRQATIDFRWESCREKRHSRLAVPPPSRNIIDGGSGHSQPEAMFMYRG